VHEHGIGKIAETITSAKGRHSEYEVYACQLLKLASCTGGQIHSLFLCELPREDKDFPHALLAGAAYTNHIPLVNKLADLHRYWSYGEPLGDAVEASIKARNHDVLGCLLAVLPGKTGALRCAISHGDLDLVKYVLGLTCSLAIPWYGCRAMGDLPIVRRRWKWDISFVRTPSVEVFETMLEELRSLGPMILDAGPLGQLAFYAAGNGWEIMLKHLISIGAPLEELHTYLKRYPLMRACEMGHDGVVQILLDNGAILRGPEIRYAAQHGHTSTVSTLLKSRTKLDPAFKEDCLHTAARNSFADIVRLLLDFGVDPNNGEPAPLIGAVESEHTGIVRLLVGKGARVCQILPEARRRTELQSMLELLDELASYPEDVALNAPFTQI
jgi:hypothetical protein